MTKDLLFVNAAQVVTCAGPARARKGKEMREAGILKNAAVAVSDSWYPDWSTGALAFSPATSVTATSRYVLPPLKFNVRELLPPAVDFA